MSKLISILLVCVVLFGMVSCKIDNDKESTADPDQTFEPQDETTTAEESMPSGIYDPSQGLKLADLNELMQPIFSGNTVKNETVMFLDEGEVKKLLFPIESVISVTSYDGKKVYKEGVDYSITSGKLKVLEGSSIPCITTEQYYNCPGSKLTTVYNGQNTETYWGENKMYQWQVNVNYTHTKAWREFEQPCEAEVFENFIKKLENGEDVTVIFYGDSITNGANASWLGDYAPYQHSYPMLFTEALADLFDYTVKYVRVNDSLTNTPKVPTKDYVAGTRGTITYINTAVGGWTSVNGKDNVQNYIINYVNTYGCDLLVLAYGMNDGTNAPSFTSNNLKAMADSVLKVAPEANIVLLSTMVSNPADVYRSATSKANQRNAIKDLAKEYVKDGVACGVCDMGSVSLAVLKRKDFHDYSGNNINHPNDFFGRIYAQTLLQTVIGYENMN